MKDLLKKMAQVANELDLKGLEKEANKITQDMLKIAQTVPSGMLQERMQQGQFKLQQSSLDEINKFVTEHNLSKEDAYAWIKGKFDARQANDWAAMTSGQPVAGAQPKSENQAGQTDASANQGSNDGGLSLDPIQPLASSKTKKEIFAQGASPATPAGIPATPPASTPAPGPQQAPAMDLKTLLSTAQNIQNTNLAQPLANYNSSFNRSFSQGGVQALGELALEYNNLSGQIQITCQSISGLLDKNINSLNQLPPTKKIQVAENIFQPIRKLIAKLQEQRRSKINPNLGGLFAGSAGGNLEDGDEKLNYATKHINGIINKMGGSA